ncbi:APC family permease [Mycobacterium aquaticum]|uniref:Amino acid transporter n=1 Tax=Mycobacterium aquaticum TaxID=1927124 RepID=A0A1X0B9S8_9MYCO|nr:APC family permease [Mycobacterium aquaticum]ORA39074.1 amino acid transporter [Mycobacterium aquaticum]
MPDRLSKETTEATPKAERYEQELSRSLGLWGNVALCVAAITPAVGVFAIAPILLNMAGTGAVWALMIAGILGLSMAACYGELGSAYPIAGGDYSVVARTLGNAAGFVSLIFTGPVCAFLIPAVVALTIATYLNVVIPLDARWVGAAVIAVGTVVAILGVRLSARLVGLLLAVELLVVMFVTALGFVKTQHSLAEVLTPTVFGPHGGQPLAVGALLAAVAVAAFTYNGFQGALLFSEETSGGGRNIARSVFISLAVAVSFGVIPVLGGLLGARSLAEFTTSATPWQQFLTDTGGESFNTIVSLGIALAVTNGVMALTPYFARVIYSSGRDMMWPTPISRALAKVHPRFETPWVATLVIGVAGVILILTTDVEAMATVIGTVIALEMILVALSAIVGRVRFAGLVRPYRMPLWPAAPVSAIALAIVVLVEQSRTDQLTALGIVVVSLLYYACYLRSRKATHMKMLDPAESD